MPYGLMVDGRLKELRDASHYLLSPQETLLATTGDSDGLFCSAAGPRSRSCRMTSPET